MTIQHKYFLRAIFFESRKGPNLSNDASIMFNTLYSGVMLYYVAGGKAEEETPTVSLCRLPSIGSLLGAGVGAQ